MDFYSNLAIGLGVAFTPSNLAYCFIGCLLGTLVGVLPGIGPVATIAMLLPITLSLDPTTSLIMLAGIYYGAQYGGSTTAILINLPGEASSVITAIDGHQLARQGKAGLALSTAALGSFFAGSVATLVIAIFGPMLAFLAIQFGAAEYFCLMFFGLILLVTMVHGSVIKSLSMILLGLVAGTIGVDATSGAPRLTFGIIELTDGLNIVAVAMGIFGLGEIIHNLSTGGTAQSVIGTKISNLWPTRRDFRRIALPVLRGTGIGAILGILPGGGGLLASFSSYALEKKVARDKSLFGQGAIEGVAGPESANNAAAQTSFIPLLTLGLPSNVIMAMMAGAMIIQGVQPGPQIISRQPELFWGLIASMWIGNLMLVVLNLPLVRIWVYLLSIPYSYLFPAIIVFCGIGVFTLSNSTFDLYVMVAFGLIGYIFRRLDCEATPFLLGMVLGPMTEEYLRRAMLIARGDPLVILQRPISVTLLIMAAIVLAGTVLPSIRKTREAALQE
jgi:putative tricarboxylic transport membrane protein